MFRSIVVALDLEQHGDRALRVARSLAALGQLPVELLTVSPPSRPEAIEAAELERRASQFGLASHMSVVHADEVACAITEHVHSTDGALLVMATTAKGPLGEHLLGSVSEDVLDRLAAAVLLVGPKVSPNCRLECPTLVVGVDVSNAAAAANSVIASWVETFDGEQPWFVEVLPAPLRDEWDVAESSQGPPPRRPLGGEGHQGAVGGAPRARSGRHRWRSSPHGSPTPCSWPRAPAGPTRTHTGTAPRAGWSTGPRGRCW